MNSRPFAENTTRINEAHNASVINIHSEKETRGCQLYKSNNYMIFIFQVELIYIHNLTNYFALITQSQLKLLRQLLQLLYHSLRSSEFYSYAITRTLLNNTSNPHIQNSYNYDQHFLRAYIKPTLKCGSF